MLDGRILFLGGGRMAQALVGGLIRSGVAADQIAVSDPDPAAQLVLGEAYGLTRLFFDNPEAYKESLPDTVLFAVKPKAMSAVATDMAPWLITERPLLISIVAGVCTGDVARWTGGACPVVRVMPNTPALVGKAVSVLYAGTDVSTEQRDRAEKILSAVGITTWVDDERLVDTATAVSGSGPAYFFHFLEVLVEGAREQGLSEEQARLLVLETAHGALHLIRESEDQSLADLRAQVTSPGGTTEAALQILEEHSFPDAIRAAVTAARRRAQEIGDENSRA